MKTIILITICILMIPLVSAIDNCKPYTPVDEIPCLILYTNATPCNNINVSFYDNNSNLLYTQTMGSYSGGFKCNATFNQTNLGTYPFLYSTGDTGTIVVEGGNKMEILIYAAIALSFLVLYFSFLSKNEPLASLAGILMGCTGVFILANGFSVLNNLISLTLGAILAMGGFYILLMANLEFIQEILN